MSVGNTTSVAAVNNTITQNALGLRAMMQQIGNLNTFINGGGNGLQALQEIGFSTVPTSANPGGVSDAQYALTIISYLNNIAGVYYGTVQQGGSGGTGAIQFDFDTALAPMWGGQ